MLNFLAPTLLILFSIFLLVSAILDSFLYVYKKGAGRSYYQVEKPGIPNWVISLHAVIEITGYLGFIATLIWVVYSIKS